MTRAQYGYPCMAWNMSQEKKQKREHIYEENAKTRQPGTQSSEKGALKIFQA